jgi:hypothetical protein
MAKDKNGKGKKADKAEKETKAEEREFKFGVEDIAEELGIKPASVRVQLRNKGIEKAGKSYGWNSKSDLREVIDQIRSNGDADEKPAKKSKDKKADKSSKKSKKSKKDNDDE